MKIGIFGGSFSPPHKMHKKIVSELIKKGYVDKIIIVPTADSYEKKYLLPGTVRYKMLCNIFENVEKAQVSDYEIKGHLHTLNTLNNFKEKYPKADIYFICGADNLNEFDTWYKYEKILKEYKLLVVERNLHSFEKIVKKYEKYKSHIILASIKPQELSSSMIRKKILENGYTDKLKDYLYVDTIKRLKKIDVKKYWL